MKRKLKSLLRLLLPRSVLDRLKQKMESRLFDTEAVSLQLEKSETSIRCLLDHDLSFLAPTDCEYALSYDHLLPECRGELRGIVRAARRGGVLFDVGAHAGIVSAIFCAAQSTNTAYSFEPSPTSQERLKAIRDLNHLGSRMSIQPVAIGEKSEKIEMLHDPSGGYVQVQRFAYSMWDAPHKILLQVESIPVASTRLGIVPDYLKLDIESFEYEAVIGAKNFLREHQPIILLELHLNYLEERGKSARELIETLRDCGYSFFTYRGRRLNPSSVYDSPLSCLRLLVCTEKQAGEMTA